MKTVKSRNKIVVRFPNWHESGCQEQVGWGTRLQARCIVLPTRGISYRSQSCPTVSVRLYSAYLWVHSAYLPSFNMTSQLCWETIERPQIFCPTWWRACWTSASSKNGQDEVLQLSSSACGIVDASTYLKHWPLLLVSRAQYLVGLTIVCSQCSFNRILSRP